MICRGGRCDIRAKALSYISMFPFTSDGLIVIGGKMKKLRCGILLVSVVLLSVFFCMHSFCAVSNKVYNTANVTYLHSNGETPVTTGPDAEEYADGTPVVLPIISNLCMAKGKNIPVDIVSGLKATLSNTEVTLSWSPVTRYSDLDTVQLQIYVVYYSTSSRSGYQVLTTLNSQTFSCTHIIGPDSPTYFYTMVAVDDMDNTSVYSVETDKSSNLYAFRSDAITTGDTYTRLFIPGDAASALYQGGAGNPYPNEDVLIEVTRVQEDEGKLKQVGSVRGLVATSMSFDAYKYSNRDKAPSFVFPANVKITLRYEVENGLIKNTTLSAAQAKDRLGLYYFDGLKWIKLPAEIDTVNQILTTTINHLSKYALISGASNPTKLTLSERRPPIFTPNNDGTNDYVFFTFLTPSVSTSEIKLRIFDLSGSLVREVDPGSGVTSIGGTMRWDGKDSAGNVMESGIYIYQIQAGDDFISGSVVLAK